MNESKEQLETLLSDYVDGNLVGDQLATVEAYLDKNPGVRDAVNRIIVDSESLRSLPRVTAPFDFSEDVKGQLERDLLLDDGAIQFPRRQRISSLLATVAAMLILFIGLGGAAYWMLANRPTPFLDVAINSSAPKAERPQDELAAAPSAAPANRDEATPEAFSDRGPAGGARPPATASDHEVRPGVLRDSVDEAPKDSKADVLAVKGATDQLGSDVSPVPQPSTAGAMIESSSRQAAAEPSLGRGASRELDTALDVAPTDIYELVQESPRFSDNAVAMVMDNGNVEAINGAVNSFALNNSVRTQSLSYDARRNRALLPATPANDNEAGIQPNQQTQVSGTSLKVPLAGGGEAMFSTLPDQPQVMMAIGLTASQVSGLRESLGNQLGRDRLQAFALQQPNRVDDKEVRAAPAGKALDEQVSKPVATSLPSLIAVGDRLRIELLDPDAKAMVDSRVVVVDELGLILPPKLEPVPAAGMTLAALRQSLVEAYITKSNLHDPVVQIETLGPATTQPSGQTTDGASEGVAGLPQPHEVSKAKLDDDESARFDVYLVVRGEAPSTQPSEVPATQPAK